MKQLFLLACALLTLAVPNAVAQKRVPWTQAQLMPPATLAQKINNKQAGEIMLVCVGPDAMIPGSMDIGPGQEKANIGKLKTYLNGINRNREVVVYCGCCPFDKCPNIRPAFQLLQEMGFKNGKVLDLPQNIKANWLDKGYPVTE
jgi:hypothetical protein